MEELPEIDQECIRHFHAFIFWKQVGETERQFMAATTNPDEIRNKELQKGLRPPASPEFTFVVLGRMGESAFADVNLEHLAKKHLDGFERFGASKDVPTCLLTGKIPI